MCLVNKCFWSTYNKLHLQNTVYSLKLDLKVCKCISLWRWHASDLDCKGPEIRSRSIAFFNYPIKNTLRDTNQQHLETISPIKTTRLKITSFELNKFHLNLTSVILFDFKSYVYFLWSLIGGVLIRDLEKKFEFIFWKSAGNLVAEIKIERRRSYVEFEELGSLFQWMELW